MTAPVGTGQEEPTARSSPRATVGTTLWLLALAWGAGISSYPLTDNSFLTHLATGRLILDRGSVPTTDPYTFTAAGTDWTVQSWLMSLLYASAERSGGVVGLRILVLVLFLAAAALLWSVSRDCVSLVPRIALVFGTLFIVTGLWGERPYMVGVIGLGLVWMALEGRIAPWALVPVFWVWANSHGSFPLGLGLMVLVLIGRRLDGLPVGPTARALGFAALGTLLAPIGPLGPDVLLFPLTALTRSDLLIQIVEWQPASFRSTEQRLFLVMVVLTVLALVRRPSWRHALPAVAFIAAAVVAQRNIVMAVMVLLPVLAARAPVIGVLTVDRRPALVRAHVAIATVTLAAAVVYVVQRPLGSLDPYPAVALAWVDNSPLGDERTATQDFVGNFLEGLDGEEAEAFIDDRVDMLPVELVEDGLALVRGAPNWSDVLDDRGVEVVVWERREPLGSLLAADDGWRTAYSDTEWIVSCRRGSSCDTLSSR